MSALHLSNIPVGAHNVFRVNETVFQQCMIPPAIEALTNGYDVITLATPGRKWYICGVGKHCEMGGMKLFINVLPQSTPLVPSVSPPLSSGKVFVVRDDKVFRYPMGKHNLFRVNGTSFQQCNILSTNEALTGGYDVITLTTLGRKWDNMKKENECITLVKYTSRSTQCLPSQRNCLPTMHDSPAIESLTSGYDVITLATPGRKWYICGVGKHCEMGGMKLFINVLPQSMPPVPSVSPPLSSGKVFVVGDDKGWTLNFEYQAWAMGKEFVVGDKLVFRYPIGKHNVFRVNGTSFQQCRILSANEALTSGYDVITITTLGRKWYICGVGKHSTVAALATSASAKVFIVGDDKGWTLNFDYQAWAYGKQFVVGDKLVFKYGIGKHNVFQVNKSVFQQCMIPPTIEALTSGYDLITLATPRRKWYICGVGKHCELGGMKIFINVLPQPMPPVSSVSPPPPSGKVFMVRDDKGWTLNFDYQAWATGKEFVVGDKLGIYALACYNSILQLLKEFDICFQFNIIDALFRYPMRKHNVFTVNGTSLQQCTIPFANEALTTGYDVITLVTP
ncbi:hypothetical protein OSB04_010700 [Centaurea solstitialis]|uniref:Phytocyanin domain-containing protein n=1 Tax=Centaurea solstitialis TaxID=347529 RepID=A0AA38WPK1_9ASTR|nr:hypothetical protein OSB04_010700 [Centaurea solstitialis]